MVQAHPEYRIARLHEGEIGGGVGLRSGVRLDVSVGRSEQLLGSVDGELLGDIDELAAAIVTLAGVAFGVLVGENRSLCLEHAGTGVVLGRDQLDVIFLAAPLAQDRPGQLGVEAFDRHRRPEHFLRPSRGKKSGPRSVADAGDNRP
jgi:hypothetical protein